MWRYIPESDRFSRNKHKKPVKAKKLLKYLTSQATTDLLVQRCLVGDTELSDLALTAIPTFRLITMTDETGGSELVAGVFRMPVREKAVVDNFHAGGIASPIDVDSGTIGPAVSMNFNQDNQYDVRLASGARIARRKIPNGSDVVSLVHEAHRCFSPRTIVGWDVCPSEHGPVLVEGNAQPNIGLLQRPYDKPFGNERFGQLLAHHIRSHLNGVSADYDVSQSSEI